MPIYEYQCGSCGRTLEKRQKFSDAALTVCPSCNGHLEKLISAPAVQFKGGGWYADLYSSSKGGKTSGEGATSGDSAAASNGSGDTAGGNSSTSADSSASSKSSSNSSGSAASSSASSSTPAPSAAPASTSK